MFTANSPDKEIILFIYKISRLVRKQVTNPTRLPDELSMLQMNALMNLSHGPLTMSQIAKELYIQLPTASSLADRLIEAGYVKRSSDKLDRRITKIELTAKGKHILSTAMKTKMKHLKFILDKLSPNEKNQLNSILKNLHKKLDIQS